MAELIDRLRNCCGEIGEEAAREIARLTIHCTLAELQEYSLDELIRELHGMPKAWYPLLTAEIVKAGYEHGVWQPTGASLYVMGVEDRIAREGKNEPATTIEGTVKTRPVLTVNTRPRF